MTHPKRVAMLTLLTTCALALGCRDTVGSQGYAPEFDEGGAAATVAIVRCDGEARTGELVCVAVQPGAPTAARGPARAIVGAPNVQLSSYNVAYDTTTLIFGFDAKVKNQLAEAIGTPDGSRVTGLKVFYELGPTATSYYAPGDTVTVAVSNPDGTGHFTKANQPYHLYPQLVAPGDTTVRKRWELRIPRAVKTFSFQVRVFTARVGEVPVPSLPPTAFISPALQSELYAHSNTVYAHARGNGAYPRNVVRVAFAVSATLEERQAAVDAVRGEVIGGVRMGADDGYYMLRVPEDGTVAPVWGAVDRLAPLPQVEYAAPDFELAGTMSQRTSDGAGWQTNDWDASRQQPGRERVRGADRCTGGLGLLDRGQGHTVVVLDRDAIRGGLARRVIDEPANDSALTTGLMCARG